MSYVKTNWVNNSTDVDATYMNNIESGIEALDIGKEPNITKNTAFNQNFETSTSNIKMNGTASVGVSDNVARADHVHLSDTSKANASDLVVTNGNVANNASSINTINEQLADIAINVKSKGAKGDGVTDDTQAIIDALNYLSSTGGIVLFPKGTYKFTSQIVVPNRVNLKGVGMAEADKASTDTRPTRLVKSGAFDGIILNFASSLTDMSVDGDVGNTGLGIKLNGNRSRLENVCVAEMGGDGVVVGDALVDGNRNYWRMINVTSRKNGGRGFVINDYDPGSGPDTNAGYAEQCNAWTNVGDGWYLDNTVVSTYVQCYAETNGGNGWNVNAKAKNNTFLNCGSEGNVGSQFIFQTNSTNNLLVGSMTYTPVDNGNNVVVQAVGGGSQVLNVSRTINTSADLLQRASAVTQGVKATGTTPGIMLYETDAIVNEKEWEIIANAGNLSIRTTDDNGASPVAVVTLNRDGQNLESMRVVGKIIVNGLGVTNSVTATTPGNVVKKMQVFDIAGSSLGYIPIYDAIN